MASPSRVDRLIKALGGEENLPPKLPQPANITATPLQSQDEPNTNTRPSHQDIPPINDFLQEQPSQGHDWWNAKPKITQPPPRPQRQPIPPPETAMRPAPLGMNFCPLIAITKFPYKFVNKKYMQQIATAFFDEGKIWSREWEVYSIWSTEYDTGKPVVLVPESQVLALINEINSTFPKANVKITDSLREDGLVINFDDISSAELRPRFLGSSTSRDQIEGWADSLNILTPNMSVEGRTLEAFKAKMDLIAEINRTKTKAQKQKRQADQTVKRQDMKHMLVRSQRYLGLLPNSEENRMPDVSTLDISTNNANSPAPNSFYNDVVFISVDVEAFEDPPHPITEVGIATLDTRDLRSISPGPNGETWQPLIRARHFQIQEHKHKVNRKWVEGCPDKFEFNNHKSTVVPDRDISKTVSDCFKPPYSNKNPSMRDSLDKRNVVLVGHDINADINYLRRIGVSLANFSCIIDTVDTAALYRAYKEQAQTRSLGHVLAEFDLMGWHLHNAGNDAVYTLWAMLAICAKNATEEGSGKLAEKREEWRKEREENAVEQAKERVKDESVGWDDVGDDGGVPVPPGELGAKGKANSVLYTAGGKVLDV